MEQSTEPRNRPTRTWSLNFDEGAKAIHTTYRYPLTSYVCICVQHPSALPGCMPSEGKDSLYCSQLSSPHFTHCLAQTWSFITMFWRKDGWWVGRLSPSFRHESDLSPNSGFCQHSCSYSFFFIYTRCYILFHSCYNSLYFQNVVFPVTKTSTSKASRAAVPSAPAGRIELLRPSCLHFGWISSETFCSFFCHLLCSMSFVRTFIFYLQPTQIIQDDLISRSLI